jgi:hypothetical protein
MEPVKPEVYILALAWTLIVKKANMTNTVAAPEMTTEWVASYIKEKQHASGKRALAKHYREEFFIEYSSGDMPPEKKTLIARILGPNFFAPVDKFDSECQQEAAFFARKAQEEGRG